MRRSREAIARPRAFTLVELLVVIGIISTLIALLMPALARTRQNAQKLQCASNLRTLGQVLTLHANDHRGYFPLAGEIAPGSNGMGLDDPASLCDPQQQRYDYYANWSITSGVTVLPAALAPYLVNQTVRTDTYQNVEADVEAPGPLQNAFLCPTDESTIQRLYQTPLWISNHGSGTYLGGWSSYGINEEIFGWADAGTPVINDYYFRGTVTGHCRARGKISAVPNPSQTMLMCDTFQSNEVWVSGPNLSLGDVYTLTYWPVNKASSSRVFDLSRHRGLMNILFADGHVESLPILSNGATSANGPIGSAGNSPSLALMSVSMDRDFR